MRVYVGSKLVVCDPTQEVIDYCRDNLILHNPDYDKKQRMGLWTGNVPKEFCLYEKIGYDLILPFGCLWKLHSMAGVEFESRISPMRYFNYQKDMKLYNYQNTAVALARGRKNGVLVMPCGAGKTQTGLALIAKIGGRALWLTHTQDLLNQSFERAKSVFKCDYKSYGKITDGRVHIGEGLTFATIQTMAKLDLEQYRDMWDVIIVDECHKAVGSPTRVMQFYKVLSNLSCRYKYGLTATPKRADGLEKSMFALLGDIIYEVTRDTVKSTTCPVKVDFVESGYEPDYSKILLGDGTINYASLVDDLIHDTGRFGLVSEVIKRLDPPVLVLANRVEYLKMLQKAYGEGSVCLSTMGASKAAKEKRKETLRKLNDLSDFDVTCVFATYQLAKEGLDVPNLGYVVFATPEKDETTITQSVGRVGRKAPGKKFGTVIDFVDSNFGMYRGWQKKRRGYYKKIGVEVKGEKI